MKKFIVLFIGVITLLFATNVKASKIELPEKTDHEKVKVYLFWSSTCKNCHNLISYFGDKYDAYEDYFEIEARNQKEAALIVAKFVIENEIIEIDTTIPIEFEVEEIEEEPEKDFEEDDNELDAESFMKMQCENCKHYCPYCGKCSLGE